MTNKTTPPFSPDDIRLDGLSMDLEQTEQDKLASVFPQCFSEGKLDIDKLLALCGEYIDDSYEKYSFRWHGKVNCLRLAHKRSVGALRPQPLESVNFETTNNVYIEGDNLEVLKLLQRAYYGRVKMIYIDPPYNTGNDFVYEDDFRDTLARYKEVTSQTTKSNPESMGRFHTNWLNMMYPRLRLAYTLLREDGVCFISIDDNEVHNLRKLCDETFGEENFIASIVWQKRTSPDARKKLGAAHEYILVYAKDIDLVEEELNLLELSEDDKKNFKNPDNDPRGPWVSSDFTAQGFRPNQVYKITTPGGAEYTPEKGRCWMNVESIFLEQVSDGRFWFGSDGKGVPRRKTYLSEREGKNTWTWWTNKDVGHTQEATRELKDTFDTRTPFFDFPKPVRLIKRLISLITKPDSNDIVLDFFSGSGTTAHAVMELNKEDGGNRRFIMVQLPELTPEKSEAYKAGYKNICEIGKERIRRAGRKLLEIGDQPSLLERETPLDVGFKVLRLDTSNFKIWDPTPVGDDLDALAARLNDMVDRLKPDRTEEEMVYELMLKMGVPLSEQVSQLNFGNKTIHSVGENHLLLIALSGDIEIEEIEKMADLAPGKIVVADNAFADDNAMSNAYYLLRDREIQLRIV